MPIATEAQRIETARKASQVLSREQTERSLQGAGSEPVDHGLAQRTESKGRSWKAQGEHLWRLYRQLPSDAHRNQLVEHYQSLVDATVAQFAKRLPNRVDRGDLGMAANLGVMTAIKGFDPERGVQFEFYCRRRIRGALLDELRAQDWLPRAWRQLVKRRKRALDQLGAGRHGQVRDEDVAQQMGMTVDSYSSIFGPALPDAPTGSGFDAHGDASGDLLEVIPDMRLAAPGEVLTREELLQVVTQKLTDKESRIIHLRYWEELSMREIGEMLDLSESRVCKIHVRLIDRLRERFGEETRE